MRQPSPIRQWCRNVNLLSIDYAFRPRLRTDSPWVDLRCPGNLGFAVDRVLTCLFATYANILTSLRSTVPYETTSLQRECSPTAPTRRSEPSSSVRPLAPGIFGAKQLDQ